MVHIYSGNGKGKTTCALGLVLRAFGSGMHCAVFQFLKNGDSSEIKPLQTLSDVFWADRQIGFVHQMAEEEILLAKAATESLFEKAEKLCETYDLIVLDEVFGAIENGFLNDDSILKLIKSHPEKEFVLTGRNASQILRDAADYVTDMQEVKHPYQNGVQARKGIEY